MLYADKRAIETHLSVKLLKIREKELNFYHENCMVLARNAALLAGFSFYGIIMADISTESSDLLKTCYLCLSIASMGFGLIAVVNATLCGMLGPGLALRGPNGSIHHAVDGLMIEYRSLVMLFVLCTSCFLAKTVLFAWLQYSWQVALSMTLTLFVFIFDIVQYIQGLCEQLTLDSDDYVMGKFDFQNRIDGAAASAHAEPSASSCEGKIGRKS